MSNKKSLFLFATFFVLYELTNYLSNDMIMPAMPAVVKQFNAPLEYIALSLTFFIIGGSTLQIFLAPIVDSIGKRKVLLFGNLLFLLASAIIPFSHSINQFLLARFFQGMGMCFIFIGYAMIHELFDDIVAVKITSILSNISIFAPLIGPIIGTGIISISRWEFVFIVSGVLGIISFIGLYKVMPKDDIKNKNINIPDILKSYKNIFVNMIFVRGITAFALSIVPLVGWIGISPVIILENQHQSFNTYLLYQCVVFIGYIISSIVINKVAGRLSFYKLINYGSGIAFGGLIISGMFCWINTWFVILGMTIYAIGVGLYNGAIIRISLSSTGESMNLSSAAMTSIDCIFLSLGLELFNKVCHIYNYSIESFALINLALALPVFWLTRNFAKINKNRQWTSNTNNANKN